jgi:lysine-N-methylase
MKTIKCIVPSYYKDFTCIGAACEDNCCEMGWNIDIDKKTYQKYRDFRDPEFKATLDKHIKRNRRSNTDNEYAKIVQV